MATRINEALIAANLKKVFEELDDIRESIPESIEGPQGFKGDRGAMGPQGNIGPAGPEGQRGLLGEQGPAGPAGPQGQVGQQGPQGEKGEKGDRGDITVVTGPTGPQGEVGPQGEIGPVGPQGSTGERGPKGVKGDRGLQGIQGPKGDKGDKGEKGETGLQGPEGVPGAPGIQGDRGIQGVPGEPGPKGEKGDKGPQGEVGPQGPQGLQGPPGQAAPKVDTRAITAPVIEEFSNQHRNHIREIQKALSLGGGGSMHLQYLSDVEKDTAQVDGKYLKYDATKKLWVGAEGGGGGSSYADSDVNAFMLSGSSTGITTAGDLTVNGVIYADSINLTSTGSTKFTSGNEFILSAVDRVKVPNSPFQVANMSDSDRGNISLPENGDIIYNTSLDRFEGYQNSSWVSLSSVSKFNIVNNGASDYTFSDDNNHWFPTAANDPELFLRRGDTYLFNINSPSHPFEIRISNGGAAYTTGITNNGIGSGIITFKVPMSAPSTLYYQCTIHSGMGNTINIV